MVGSSPNYTERMSVFKLHFTNLNKITDNN